MPANDGGSHGWYMLIDPQGGGLDISWHRLEYDYEISQRLTTAAEIAEYGQALGTGLWPNTDILPEIETRQTGQPLNR